MNGSLEVSIRARLDADGPIRVGIVGAGTSGRMIARHLLGGVHGIRLVAVANRTLSRAAAVLADAGERDPVVVKTGKDLSNAFSRQRPAITEDAELLCSAQEVDVLVEVTGTVEFGARIVLKAIENRKHVVLVNAELDSTLGPILKVYADAAGVTLTHTDGEEPGVAMTLVRYLRMIGLRPVAAGNLKGMIDRYRTPETQRAFATKHNQDPAKVTSFADGTKLCMESTILANASGFKVGKRGMHGPRCAHVKEIASLLPADQLLNGGLVDYALGAEPYTGAFVVAYEDQPAKRAELEYFKMGEGPFFVFYTPYHLPHLQIASTIARAALFNDATVAPAGAPVCEVVAVAKRDLKRGQPLDGVGGFDAYGLIENATASQADALLPMGLSEGCRLCRDVRKDQPISYRDVELPPGRLCDRLNTEQIDHFIGKGATPGTEIGIQPITE
jgi:predicted homoserine dehydrogenase-like protein